MTTKQRKSGSTSKRTKKRSSKANGVSKKNDDELAVGTVIELAKEDAATIKSAVAPISSLYEQLGREHERHRQAVAQLSKALADANAEHRSVILTVAGKYGVNTKDPSQTWNIDESQSQLTRIR